MKSSDKISIGCVILAAGSSTRFGSNKLFAEVGGKALIERALDAAPTEELSGVAVVTQYGEIATLAAQRGFLPVMNDHPELGLSLSVRLGTDALRDRCDGILYLVADQPWLKRASAAKMTRVFRENPDSIIAMSHNTSRGNPCIFPGRFFDELCAVTGDRGGRTVIDRHGDDLILFEVSEAELADVDTREELFRIN